MKTIVDYIEWDQGTCFITKRVPFSCKQEQDTVLSGAVL